VYAGDASRWDTPVEVDLPIGNDADARVALYELDESGSAGKPVVCQTQGESEGRRLVFVARGAIPAHTRRRFYIYFAPTGKVAEQTFASTVRCADGPKGTKQIENEHFRLLVGPEGAHIYRWEVKALGNRDLTYSGQTGWAGFADIGVPHRDARNRLELVADGPAMVRLRCTDPSGIEKVISAYAGLPWIEVTLDAAVGYFWCFDDIALLSAQSPTPGTYLFSDGKTGAVGKASGLVDSQFSRPKAHWCAKFAKDGPVIGLITPEVATRHVVGPGGGMGGVGIERSTPAAHFVIVGGQTPASPEQTMKRLLETLDYRKQPQLELCAVQKR